MLDEVMPSTCNLVMGLFTTVVNTIEDKDIMPALKTDEDVE